MYALSSKSQKELAFFKGIVCSFSRLLAFSPFCLKRQLSKSLQSHTLFLGYLYLIGGVCKEC